ncbi:hypothetical protein H2198_000038 [Neophaeococcomyces mojaviensis]|uniref:Uncharacterized protein n=1 Tax=Neophaeococcomyces mojaviensis TaxID=3383035 RepID=A0ACC3AKQ7_9EURO|nr:hypothetical protein H2198_000038 [Knufia sp. JES_112]
MSEATAPSDEATVTFNVKSSSGPKCTVTIPLSTSVADLKTKLAEPEFANVPAASQRLIYSGKVLKDHDTLATYNIKDGNTMHLVRSAASNQRQNPASQSTPASADATASPAAAGVPQTFASGTGNDPLAGLTGARYAGFAGLPSMQELANPPTMDDMVRRLQDPSFAQQMNEALQNPQMIDMMINMNPQLRAMGPRARQMLQSEHFRRMMTDPETIRSMMNMQRMFGNDPLGGMGGGQEEFPMPGATNTTDQQHQAQAQAQGQGQQQPDQQNPFAGLLGGAGAGAGGMNPFMFMPPPPQQPQANPSDPSSNQNNTQQANPFAALFAPGLTPPQAPNQGQTQPAGQQTDSTTRSAATDPSSQPPNPFANLGSLYNNPMMQQMMQNPEAMRNAMQMLQGTGIDPFAMLGGGGFAPPADNRPPEERYATQLRQLNEMGFFNYDQNIQALTRSGGDVNGALEWLFSQPQS